MVHSSLLISTYNWPAALDLCLMSAFNQSILPGEIIICDDGSTRETELVIRKYQALSQTPILHVWQEDEGFKLGQIRNKGIAKATGDYVIQIDGDLILHKHFIKDHLKLCKKKYFTTGSRVLLAPETTEDLIDHSTIDVKKFSKNARNIFNGMRIPMLHEFLSRLYKTKGRHRFYVKGCNMAFWKNDLLAINGYNEDFTGWGKEDSEIAIRLINAGITKQFLKFGGITYHLYHKEASREMEQKNFRMMQQAVDKKLMRALKGVDQYL